MLFQFLLTKLSCLQKVDHVTNYCKKGLLIAKLKACQKDSNAIVENLIFFVIYVAKYNLSHIAGQNFHTFYILFTYFGAFFDDFTRFLFS